MCIYESIFLYIDPKEHYMISFLHYINQSLHYMTSKDLYIEQLSLYQSNLTVFESNFSLYQLHYMNIIVTLYYTKKFFPNKIDYL